ncbi:type II CAAX prenyl endopeptidase Rce1 family protein [Hyalangium minutum]|uniref:Putative membrane associated protease n=1 Tax=Hyalangium minutum TaxID=394096 RepID=A0A085WIX8_9BACT|nr:CPBP family glutamic-type intramembrane protease [Hyalangium minutum]KFE67641.1 putative membrane associated protease [Hyalangium minutum]
MTVLLPSEQPPAPPSPQRDSEERIRQFFLWALVAGIVPVLGLPVVLGLTLLGRREAASPSYQRWYRRLVALAILDVLVAAASLSLSGGNWKERARSPKVLAAPRVLGVTVDPDSSGPGLRLAEVDPRGPAAAAGLKAGEVVLRAEEQPLSSSQHLSERIQSLQSGAAVRLEVESGGARREVRVVPVEASELPPLPRGLFEPQPRGVPVLTRDTWKGVLGLVLPVGALLGLWGLGRRRGADTRPLLVLGALVVSGLGTWVASRGLSALLGGPSRGVVLLSGAVSAGGLLLVAAVLARRAPPVAEAPEQPRWLWVYFSSVGLLITLGARAMVLVGWVSQVLGALPDQNQHPMVEMARQGPLGPLGWSLLAIPSALLAPVGEELLFRGVLLPWLSGWMGRVATLVVSAAVFASLHLFYGVFAGWIFFLGLLLGWARLASGGLRAPMLLHVTINSVALLMLARTLV